MNSCNEDTSEDHCNKSTDRERMGYHTSPHAPNTPENNICKLITYRHQQVASFTVNGKELICLPQAFEFFLKHLVGGLHTVYTKLKRLEVVPVVCNVEQVRILRGLSAIQPGVNRCKLISTSEFDILYDDCTSSSARPGRPPKRSSYSQEIPDTPTKLLRKNFFNFEDMKTLSPTNSLPPNLLPSPYQGIPVSLGNPFLPPPYYNINQMMQQAVLQMSLNNQGMNRPALPLPNLLDVRREQILPREVNPTKLNPSAAALQHNTSLHNELLSRLQPTETQINSIEQHIDRADSGKQVLESDGKLTTERVIRSNAASPTSQHDNHYNNEQMNKLHASTLTNQLSDQSSLSRQSSPDLDVTDEKTTERENSTIDDILNSMKNNINNFILSLKQHQLQIINDIDAFRHSLQYEDQSTNAQLYEKLLCNERLFHTNIELEKSRKEQSDKHLSLARSDLTSTDN